MLPALLKKLRIASNEDEGTTSRSLKTPERTSCFKYTFLGKDGRTKGEVILEHTTNTYSDFSLKTFGLVPATSPQGVFWQEAFGKVLIDFKVNFVEGDEVDSLKGTLTLFDWESKKNQGDWIASVRSADREVAMAKGIWCRAQV